ncbi:hypothetical protein EJ05DRAFT_477716 [Pseudovirgaria hyperparasitica]|uniref:OPA3-domain-containing protein n=1 Tax=Pseudovirgaria hyperparasitica TaxID=470096 RepID=A0A6A6W119_9PEZI|nr:uncharacterized protein EJ05DRAFT_477716 [Pseudovirgaria hyperparasitica]KAF2756602.1 hypothetical protein EJ05DRAFT_477716 [Pseudovirgaria hyperparasitica]
MSLTLKIGSLVIRTLAKPIGNYIKRNAREHETFRKLCVGFAQRLHRIDMRMRLGLLQDPAVIDRQIEREVREMEARRKRDEAPTVKTEEETKAEEAMTEKEREEAKAKIKARKPRIRPLSESKAIDSGANFISESFLFLVATSIIVFESWRSRRKESNRRDDVNEKLEALETAIRTLETELHEERQKNSTSGIVKSGLETAQDAKSASVVKVAAEHDERRPVKEA